VADAVVVGVGVVVFVVVGLDIVGSDVTVKPKKGWSGAKRGSACERCGAGAAAIT
jgi:hypothetical protein